MLSKVLRGQDTDVVQPVIWRSNGVPAAAVKPSVAVVAPVPAVPVVPVAKAEPVSLGYQNHAVEQEMARLNARIAEVEAAAERRVQEAREAGYREGEAAGRQQGTAQVQPVMDKMAQSIREMAELRPKLRHEAEADVVKLAMAIAKKVLHRELVAEPEALSGLIRVAMDKIRLQEIVRVRVNPQQQPAVQQMVARFALGVQIEILSDGKMPLGGVVVETTRGEYDASVDLQLREIERGLTDRLEHARK